MAKKEQKTEEKHLEKVQSDDKGQQKAFSYKESQGDKRPEKKEKKIQIVRIAETDLDGSLTVSSGIRKVKGISFMFANAISNVCPFSDKNIIDLSDKEIQNLEDIIFHPEKYNIPLWLYNRRKDPEDKKDYHLTVSKLLLTNRMDINKMKKLKSYKGIRHIAGLPVRGQKTKSTGRKGTTIGVKRKAK